MVKRLSGTRFVAVSLLSLALLMPGCVSQYGEQQTKVNHYPQCYEPIQKLRDDENSVAKSTAAGAAIGALTGAVVGGLATGSAKGAVAGAVAGGAAGAIGGNIYGKKQAEKRDAEYMARYASMLDEDTADMNRTVAAARVAKKCYDTEFKTIIADFTAGKITRKELDERYAEIRAGLQEVSYVLKKKYDDMTAKDGEYEKALADVYTKAPAKKVSKKAKASPKNSASANKYAKKETHDEHLDTESLSISHNDIYNKAIAKKDTRGSSNA